VNTACLFVSTNTGGRYNLRPPVDEHNHAECAERTVMAASRVDGLQMIVGGTNGF
jgi:hypothetical protein